MRAAEAALHRARVRGWAEHLRDGVFSARAQLDAALLDYAGALSRLWPDEWPFGRPSPDVAEIVGGWERDYGFDTAVVPVVEERP